MHSIFVLLKASYPYRVYFSQETITKAVREQSLTKAGTNSLVTSFVDGLVTIRAMNKQQFMFTKFYAALDHYSNTVFTFLMTKQWFTLYANMIFSLGTCCSLFLLVSRQDEYTKFLLPATIRSVTFMASTIPVLCLRYMNVCEILVGAQRIEKLLTSIGQEDAADKPRDSHAQNTDGKIEFKRVYLRYREHLDYVLQDLSFVVRPGQKVGIVGRTGAGKSSILQALFRLVDVDASLQSSCILVDGVDIRELGIHTLRDKMAYIPQTPFVMAGTVRENLDPYARRSDFDIWQALDEVALKEHVEAFAEGLDTTIVDSKSLFSAGQKQLLCLARTIL